MQTYTVKEPGFILGDHYPKGAKIELLPAQARSFIKSGHLYDKRAVKPAQASKPDAKKAD